MEMHFKIIGALLCVLALVHIAFPKYFNWKKELSSLSLINRQMMQVHTFFIAFTVFLIGLLCLLFPNELTNSKLGKIVSFGFAAFWSLRLFFQFFIYSNKLWKGKRFETVIHILFSFLWIYISVVFWINASK